MSLIFPGVGHPVMGFRVEVSQVIGSDGEGHLPGLTGGEKNFPETLQFLGRTLEGSLDIRDIELHDLSPLAVTGVCHRHSDGQRLPGSHPLTVGARLPVSEGGVAQAMAEGEERLDFLRVMPAVADQDTLGILLIPDILILTLHAGIFPDSVGGDILKLHREGHRELAGGVDLAENDIGDGITGLGTEEPGLQYGRHLLDPGHRNSIAAHIDHHKVRIGLCQGYNHLILSVRKGKRLAVGILAILTRRFIETADKNHIVGLTGLGDSLGDKLRRTARFGKVLTGGHTVVFTGDMISGLRLLMIPELR